MGRKRQRSGDGGGTLISGGLLVIDRARRSGQFQAGGYREVYRDGRVFISNAGEDDADESGQEMDFQAWVASHQH